MHKFNLREFQQNIKDLKLYQPHHLVKLLRQVQVVKNYHNYAKRSVNIMMNLSVKAKPYYFLNFIRKKQNRVAPLF